MENKKIKVALGMSGGVDSSVAALLLKEKGYDVIGITMKIWDNSFNIKDSGKDACYGPGENEDIKFAEEVCSVLEIPYYTFDLSGEYKTEVLDYFRDEYLGGKTPNPCVKCNQSMKFGLLVEMAKKSGLDFDYFATGHYAGIVEIEGQNYLKQSANIEKDQSYFLSKLKTEQLSKVIFPLEGMNKDDVRKLAAKYNLSVSVREESQDFISGGDYNPLFSEKDIIPGDIVNEKGKVLGKHNGIINYTIGQRKGLGISSEKPLYVIKIDAPGNKIIVSDKEHLFSKKMQINQLNLFDKKMEHNREHRMLIKIRNKHKEASGAFVINDHENATVIFDAPQLAVTPGQIAVIYNSDKIVIASGMISGKE